MPSLKSTNLNVTTEVNPVAAIEFLLPDYWAPTLINSDPSNMSDEDINMLDQFIEECFPNGYAHVTIDSDNEPKFSKYHDLHHCGYPACDVLTYTFVTESE